MSAPSNVAAPLKSLPADMELVLKVIPLPADVNANGDILGGCVMAQCDLAGSVIPAQGGRFVDFRATVRSARSTCMVARARAPDAPLHAVQTDSSDSTMSACTVPGRS